MSKCDLQSNFIEIILRHGCSPVNLLHIFRTPFPENTWRDASENIDAIQLCETLTMSNSAIFQRDTLERSTNESWHPASPDLGNSFQMGAFSKNIIHANFLC